MKKLKRFVYIAAIIAVVLSVVAFPASIFVPRAIFEKSLVNLKNESDDVPAHVIYGVVHTEKDKVHVSQLCKKENKNISLKQIFCIFEERIYFVYVDITTARVWNVASIDLKTKTFRDLFQFSDTKEAYHADHYSEYAERNGFYYDGQIILSDFESVLSYDIHNGKIVRCDYDTYVFPERLIYGESVDRQALKLHINDSTHIFTLQEMSEKSDGIASLYALKDMETWNGSSYLAGFFKHNSIQVIEGKIYAVEPVLNFSGEPYAVILEYNHDNDEWLYVSKRFSGDTVYGKCYVIPNIVTQVAQGEGLHEP